MHCGINTDCTLRHTTHTPGKTPDKRSFSYILVKIVLHSDKNIEGGGSCMHHVIYMNDMGDFRIGVLTDLCRPCSDSALS